jgi:uncharacterized membrane protein YgaE (UPF0421/DUF939 family)
MTILNYHSEDKMETIKQIYNRFKWFLLVIGLAVIAFIVKAFGASSKQAKYEQVIKDVKEHKRDELFNREAKIQDQIVAEEKDKIYLAEDKVEELKKDLELRHRSGRNINSRATNDRLKEMGLK